MSDLTDISWREELWRGVELIPPEYLWFDLQGFHILI